MSHNEEVALKNSSTVIPRYLSKTYWWAYLHPVGVWLFERPWLVNLILFGNYRRLGRVAMRHLQECPGDTLQIACVYGQLSMRVAELQSALKHRFDVVDVAPIQLRNLQSKLDKAHSVGLHLQDSTRLEFDSAAYRNTLLFFLLHEQPEAERTLTIAEALRVTQPGGQVVIIDYAKPKWWSPLRYLLPLLLRPLEPFALDLWRYPLTKWLPISTNIGRIDTRYYFGGLYQATVIQVKKD